MFSSFGISAISNEADKDSQSRYIILRTLGKGAFGTVYLTYLDDRDNDGNLNQENKTFALKTTCQDVRYKNREGDILKMLHHPGIVEIFEIFTSKRKKKIYLNIVMECFPATLHDLIVSKSMENSMLSYSDIKWYSLQLFRTLGYLNTLNLCHRDIKPQNILVDHSKRIMKLCDFGSAKILTDAESNKHYICSRFYRAPELLCKSQFYDCNVDVWSVGCCVAEMYLSRPLFGGSHTKHQLSLIMKVLGRIPKHYPSIHTNYSSTANKGLASISDWKKVLKITQNYRKLNYPINQLQDINECNDLQFIQQILQYNPAKRLNLKQTLHHEYFKEFVFPSKVNQNKNKNIYPEIQWTKYELSKFNSLPNQ